jgi:hypothetical protein
MACETYTTYVGCRRYLYGPCDTPSVTFDAPGTIEGVPSWAPSGFRSFPRRTSALGMEPERVVLGRPQR